MPTIVDGTTGVTFPAGGVGNPAGAVVGLTDTQTLTNKTLTTPVISTISNTGTITLPTSTDTLVGRATTDTLTNKTLTSPTIATPTMTGQATIPTINLTGGQITFPATQSASSDANTLDDYEEGTFTATFSASGVTLNNANNYGFYTKIGNRVIAQIYIRCLYVSGTHADITITGFPFTSATGSYNQHGCALGYVDGFTGLTYSQIFAYITSGTATASLLNANYQGGLVNMSTSKLGGGSGAYFVATFSYQTPT